MGQAPYKPGDNTRDWIEQYRVDGKLRPGFVARVGTDTNYLQNMNRPLYGGVPRQTKSMMNLGLPGQRVQGALAWQSQESLDNPVQQATLDLLNCLYISTVTTTLSSFLPAESHSPIVQQNYVGNSLGVVDKVQGNTANRTAYFPGSNSSGTGQTTFTNVNPQDHTDSDGYYYREDNVMYRMFTPTTFNVASGTAFPDPAIPNDDDNDIPDSPWWTNSDTGVGSYYVQIGSEVVRVVRKTGNSFYIPPGGRGIGSNIQVHNPGETVTLLGIGPSSGEWTAMGYLNVSDTSPQTCLLRPGTCLVTYEGWGNITGLLSHDQNTSRNYQFTGYWFVVAVEPAIGSDGIPKITLTLKSAGNMLEAQKITPDLLRRAKSQYGQWSLQGQQIWGDNDHSRTLPSAWIDQASWDPSQPGAYPLAIQTELAQNKAFWDHMQATDLGTQCEICKEELRDWQRNKPPGATPNDEDRAVGKHIYQSSIRVMREDAGPIKTYIRLMAMLGMAAWDNPAFGTELSQSFTKIPNQLFSNMYDIYTGLCFNGKLDFQTQRFVPDEEWFSPTYKDENIFYTSTALTCPFEVTYDKAPFYQPMLDLADANGNIFWIDRLGRPCFKPRTFSMRPFNTNPEWFQSYGASIDSFSSSIDSEQIVTQAWVTGTSAFDSSITIRAAGTGVDNNGNVRVYSQFGGNSQGLGLTSGVQQVDTISVDNVVLGLDWNTNPAAYGAVTQIDGDGTKVVNSVPPTYGGQIDIGPTNASAYGSWVETIQRTLNFFVYRRYIYLANYTAVSVTGKWDQSTTDGVKALRVLMGIAAGTGIWTKALTTLVKAFLAENATYIKLDIWWYAFNKRPWEEYLSAITGVPIQLKSTGASLTSTDGTSVAAMVQDSATQKVIGDWTQKFSKDLLNVGNKYVDDSINKAVVRTISSNLADPRIICGDIIWVDVPGFLTFSRQRPFNNGVYVTNISRAMDLQAGTYSATYSGYRFIGAFNQGFGTADTGFGYLK